MMQGVFVFIPIPTIYKNRTLQILLPDWTRLSASILNLFGLIRIKNRGLEKIISTTQIVCGVMF
jgi:hypothetical protein